MAKDEVLTTGANKKLGPKTYNAFLDADVFNKCY
jgi:hypothetical protein